MIMDRPPVLPEDFVVAMATTILLLLAACGAGAGNRVEDRRDVAIARFVEIFNSGQLSELNSLVTDRPGMSDCDYLLRRPVEMRGRDDVSRYIGERVLDHDHLTLGSIVHREGDTQVAGVSVKLRTSDTLASLGFRKGIRPTLSVKVRFDRLGRIDEWAMGSVGATAPCVPH